MSTEPSAAPVPEPLRQAQHEVAEIFGNIAAFWGFTRTQGRIYGLLFLSPAPLGHREIRQELGISAGSASMTLSSLVHWGVLRREGRLYAAETDMWKVITGVFRRRERDQVDAAIDRIRPVVDRLAALDHPDPAVRFGLRRIRALHEFFELGRRFLDAFVEQGPLSGLVSTIAQRAARMSGKFRPSPPEQDAPIGH